MELLIVIAIIGILVTVSVASYSTMQKKTRDSRRISDLKAIQNAFEQYYADQNGAYPGTCSISTTYMPGGFPVDPKTGASYAAAATCTTTGYCICATAEVTSDGNSTNTSCAYGTGTYYCVSNLQ